MASKSEVFNTIIQDTFTGFEGEIHPAAFELYKNNFQKAVTTVFAGKYPELENHLKLNVSKFAAYKAFHLTKQLKSIDKSDKEAFRTKAAKSIKQHNYWAKVEENAIIGRARTARQFTKFKEDKDVLPNIKWLRTRAKAPRDIHLAIVGTILPVDDPFWNSNQPKNLWNCACDWVSTDEPVNRPTSVDTSIKAAKGLEGNPAETGEVFTKEHPYFAKAKDNKAVEKFFKKEVNEFFKPLLKEIRESIDQFKGETINSKNIATGKVTILRKSINEIDYHNLDYKVKLYLMNFKDKIKDWKYIGYSKVQEGKHKEATFFYYYETYIGGVKRFVNCEFHTNMKSEVPYTIMDKIDLNKIKEGKP